MKTTLNVLLALSLASGLIFLPSAEAGSLGKSFTRSFMSKILRRDLVRDAATVAKPLTKPRTVFRYTGGTQAAREAEQGLAAGAHMASAARPGRPLSAAAAQRRYGLPSMPEVRETLRLDGQPVRLNKALGGEAGYGELTSPAKISPEAILKVLKLR